MKQGLLIYDNRSTPLTERIRAAGALYQRKTGVAPNQCCVSPLDFNAAVSAGVKFEAHCFGMFLMTRQTVPPNYFLVGMAEER